jgi:hypothetical protein
VSDTHQLRGGLGQQMDMARCKTAAASFHQKTHTAADSWSNFQPVWKNDGTKGILC